jgi:hypothetical protein
MERSDRGDLLLLRCLPIFCCACAQNLVEGASSDRFDLQNYAADAPKKAGSSDKIVWRYHYC